MIPAVLIGVRMTNFLIFDQSPFNHPAKMNTTYFLGINLSLI